MIKELRHLLHFIVIFIFFFISLKFYLSDNYKKEFYRSLDNHDNLIKKFSKNLPTLENNTKNIIEYVEPSDGKKKKKFNFWKLLD